MGFAAFVLNGPNLNLLGEREPDVYGGVGLDEIADRCRSAGERLAIEVEFRQTNHEGVLVDWLHEAADVARGVVINPGGYTHTSVALQDAIRGIALPVIEVHLSNIFAREEFRHPSYVSPVAAGVVCGLGPQGYELALEALKSLVTDGAADAATEGTS